MRRWKLADIIKGDNKDANRTNHCARIFVIHHHQVSGLSIGNDGWLYITAGDDDNYVEGSDGSRATVLRTGGVFRCLPDGSKMQTYSIGYRNPYRDIVYDENSTGFTSITTTRTAVSLQAAGSCTSPRKAILVAALSRRTLLPARSGARRGIW